MEQSPIQFLRFNFKHQFLNYSYSINHIPVVVNTVTEYFWEKNKGTWVPLIEEILEIFYIHIGLSGYAPDSRPWKGRELTIAP